MINNIIFINGLYGKMEYFIYYITLCTCDVVNNDIKLMYINGLNGIIK